jgi:hypothetical protein
LQSAEHVRAALNWRIPIADDQFDAIYPDPVRAMSAVHWTPVDVALRATALLAPEPGCRVLDVGAGAGKLCLIGALTRRSSWHGVEVSSSLVNVARRAAKRLLVEDRVTFHGGDHSVVDWKRYDSLYFYNPFELALFTASPIEPRPRWTLFGNDVARAEQCLSELVPGTRVVTYYGFGGELPASYKLAQMERIGTGQLALWIKR